MAAMCHVYVTVNYCERMSFSFPCNVHNLYFVKLFQGQVIEVSTLPDPGFLQEIKNKLVCVTPFTST
jgi:hypothetical protein